MIELDIISERLRALRKEKDVNQAVIAAGANVARGTYASYENGTTPPIDTLIKLAGYYNVSIDYLCGLSHERKLQNGEIEKGFDALAGYIGKDAPLGSHVVRMINAAIQYYQHGAPCGSEPLIAWRSFTENLSNALETAITPDCAALMDYVNMAIIAALDVTKMPVRMLENRGGTSK